MIVGQIRAEMTSVTGAPRAANEKPEVAPRRRLEVGDELIREDRLVEAPADPRRLLHLLGHVGRVAHEDAFRRPGHRPEQQEVDQRDEEDREER